MIKKYTLFAFILLCHFGLEAQQGGSQVFSFLNLSPAGYSHSLGGIMISNASNDISTALQNPATLNTETRNAATFNYQFQTAGIGSGSAAYGNHFKKANIDWHAAIQFTDYGNFRGADEWGNETGEFSAGDYAFVFGVAKPLNEQFTIGVNTKFIYSRLEDYIATGIGMDIGGYYMLPTQEASIGIVAKNMGGVIRSYTGDGGLLPFDLQVGFTKKLKYLPFRYNITAHHLYKWDVRYSDPNLIATSNAFGEVDEPSLLAVTADNFFRHLIFGGEFLLGKKENLKLRFAYNHMLRRELAVQNIRSITGFSGGVEFKVKGFFIGYSFGLQHMHGSSKMLSISTNLGQFKKK